MKRNLLKIIAVAAFALSLTSVVDAGTRGGGGGSFRSGGFSSSRSYSSPSRSYSTPSSSFRSPSYSARPPAPSSSFRSPGYNHRPSATAAPSVRPASPYSYGGSLYRPGYGYHPSYGYYRSSSFFHPMAPYYGAPGYHWYGGCYGCGFGSSIWPWLWFSHSMVQQPYYVNGVMQAPVMMAPVPIWIRVVNLIISIILLTAFIWLIVWLIRISIRDDRYY